MKFGARLAFAAAALIARGGASAKSPSVKIGVLTDMSSLYADDQRPRLGRRRQNGGRGFQSGRARHESRGRRRRPSEQARCRLQHRAAMVRRRSRRRHRRRAEFRRRARHQRSDAREEQSLPGLRRRRSPISPDRNARPTPSIGPTTPGCLPTAPARRWSRPAATPGSSSPPTTRSATRSNATPPRSSRPTAARCSAACSHPLNNQDFSSFLLQAQSSKAKIIGLANAGGDTINAIKQGAEFGITAGGQHFAGLLCSSATSRRSGLRRRRVWS